MPTIDLDKQKEELIDNISTGITEEKELEALFNLFNKLMARKASRTRKVQKANISMARSSYSRTRVPSMTSLKSTDNVTHEKAILELDKMIETWK